jgi:ABC-type sulfate/molybdate transport systems ATPase subunit
MDFFVDIKKKLSGFTLNINLSSEHEIIGILGASGSGKSMLLKCIAGLIKPDEGKIIINGKVFFDSEQNINIAIQERKVGFLFQNYALFPHLTIKENIGFGLQGLTKDEQNKRVFGLMERYHLVGMEKRYPSQISGGQQQRVALARAMAVEPEILLLDEPFSALDDYLRDSMMKEMLKSLKDFKGTTLYVTHNRDEAYLLCRKIAVIKKGQVDVFNDKKVLFNHPETLEAAKMTGCKNIVRASRKSENCVEIPDWNISLKTDSNVSSANGFIGIRANYIKIGNNKIKENCFSGWIVDKSESPFYLTYYIKIGQKPQKADDYDILLKKQKKGNGDEKSVGESLEIFMDPKDVFFVER